MLSDARVQPGAYQPGPCWRTHSRRTAKQLRRHGLADFRGASSTIGLSYTDAVWVDVRQSWIGGMRKPVEWSFESVFPFRNVLDGQVALTKSYEAGYETVEECHPQCEPGCAGPPDKVHDARLVNLINNATSYDIFWRCVRPGKPDVGQPHAASNSGHSTAGRRSMPPAFDYDERRKIWLPLLGCDKTNSLQVLPGSHRDTVPMMHIETRYGTKPAIEPD